MKIKHLIAGISICAVSQAIAADAEKNSVDPFREVISNHLIIKKLGRENPGAINSGLYKLAIVEILQNPADRSRLGVRDLQILESMPSHYDKRFLQNDFETLMGTCAGLDGKSGRDIADLAIEVNDSREQKELDLLEHYENIIETVSKEGREVISEKLINLRSNVDVTEIEVDMYGLALESLDAAKNLISKICERAISYKNKEGFRNISIKEEIEALSKIGTYSISTSE